MYDLVKNFAKKFWPVALCMILGFASLITGIISASAAEKWSYLGYGIAGFITLYITAGILHAVIMWKAGRKIAKEFQSIRMPDVNMGVEEEEK